MRKSGLLIEMHLSMPLLRLEVSLYDDYESSLPLECNFVDNVALTYLQQMFDPLLTSLLFVALSCSSTSIPTNVGDLTLLASPLSLTQCTRLERDEPSRGDASVVEDDSLD